GRDGLGLGPAAAGAAAATALAVIGRLAPAVGAVGGGPFGLVLRILASGRFATRLLDRVGDGAGEQLHRADRIVVAGDRHGDEIRVGVGVHDRDDRDTELVRLGDGDLLLLGVDHEHEAGEPVHVLDAREVLAQLVALARHHELLFLRVIL